MKNNIGSSILSIFCLFLGLTGTASAIPMAHLDVLDSDIVVGENFGVEVWMDGDGLGEELLAFGFDVFTPAPLLGFIGYVMGPGFDDDSFGPDNVAGSAFPGIGTDDALLATLYFNAAQEGIGSLGVAGLFDGLFFGAFYEMSGFDIVAMQTITVGAGGTAPVPEPCTMLLLGSGLLGLGFVRKKVQG